MALDACTSYQNRQIGVMVWSTGPRRLQAVRAEGLLPELFLQAPTTPVQLRAQLRLTTLLTAGSAEQPHSQR